MRCAGSAFVRAILGVALLLGAGSSAWSDPKGAVLRTEILTVDPPPGWVVSVWNGGTIELAEFTPPGQTGGKHTDLLGYSVLPRLAGVTPDTNAGFPAFSRRHQPADCRQERRAENQLLDGWYSSQSLCVGFKGSRPDELILQFDVQRVGEQGVYRIWREWRGSPTELAEMLKARTGEVLSPVSSERRRLTIDDAALSRAFEALAPVFLPDLTRNEICDVRTPRSCTTLHDDLPAESVQRLRGRFIGGFSGAGMKLLPREEFRRRFNVTTPDDGSPNRVFVIAEPKDLDWSDQAQVDRMVTIAGTGIVSDGGSLVASDPDGALSADEVARIRVQVVMAGRRLWREGYPPSIISFRLSPPE